LLIKELQQKSDAILSLYSDDFVGQDNASRGSAWVSEP